MFQKKYIDPYVGETVDIGIPHLFHDRLFFYTGEILEISEDYLILKMKDGLKQIKLQDIEELTCHED